MIRLGLIVAALTLAFVVATAHARVEELRPGGDHAALALAVEPERELELNGLAFRFSVGESREAADRVVAAFRDRLGDPARVVEIALGDARRGTLLALRLPPDVAGAADLARHFLSSGTLAALGELCGVLYEPRPGGGTRYVTFAPTIAAAARPLLSAPAAPRDLPAPPGFTPILVGRERRAGYTLVSLRGRASLTATAAFYAERLGSDGWRASPAHSPSPTHLVVLYRRGPADLVLDLLTDADGTLVTLVAAR